MGGGKTIKSPTKLRLSYLAAGFTATSLYFLASFYPFEILEWLKGEPVSRHKNPQLFSILELFYTWAPWLAILSILIARIKKGSQVKIGFFLLGIGLPNIFLVGYLVLHSPIENYMNQEDFDAVVWRNSDEASEDFMWPHKLKMVDSLIESRILDNLNQEEVVKLLGTPTSDFSPEYRDQQNEIYYNLGPERGFIRIDSEWLSITFDKNGKVEKYWLWKD